MLALQLRNGAYRSEFGGYPDEAAHYVSGLMVRDYIAWGNLSSIGAFAKNYYLHYPKVAIGHWPPVFYAVQAAWTLIFSSSRISLMVLMAFLSTLMAATLYRTIKRDLGNWAGITGAVLLVVMPAVQESTRMLMADVLVGLFSLLAVLRFASFMERGKSADAAWFGIYASLTILTKGTGLALAGVPVLALAITNRWRLALKPAFWLPIAIVVPVCAPWYWWTRNMLQSTGQHPSSALGYVASTLRYYVTHLYLNLGLILFVLAVLGMLLQVVFRRRNRVNAKWAVLAALVVSISLLGSIVPVLSIGGQTQVMGAEERFLVPAMPAMIAFAMAGAHFVLQRIMRQYPSHASALTAAMVVLLIGSLVPRILEQASAPTFGFAAVAQHLLSESQLKSSAVLISSDAIGEGMFVSEVAMRDRRPGRYVARATKVLCNCSWSGEEHEALYPTPEALQSYFVQSPFGIVVYDDSVPALAAFDFHKVLAEAIRLNPARWELLRTFPVTRDGMTNSSGIKVYRFLDADPNASIKVDMERMLKTTLQVDPRQK